jgi:hypothetical protein
LGFAVVKGLLRALLGATRLVVFALIQAKEDVALEIGIGVFNGHGGILGRGPIKPCWLEDLKTGG